MYKVSSEMFPELQKKINHITKKLDKYGLMYEFKIGEPVLERVNVYRIDDMGVRVKVGDKVLKVIPYTFWMEDLKIGNWIPVATIEHDALTVDGKTKNMVKSINGEVINDNWWTIDSNCDHCGSNRRRNTTIILKNIEGSYYQVGSSCVKEFTGIYADDIIALYASIDDIYLEEAYEISQSEKFAPSGYVRTLDLLAASIYYINKEGYKKDITKRDAFILARDGYISVSDFGKAQEIIEFFKTFDVDTIPSYEQSFYLNMKGALLEEYTNCNGLVVYSPLAYEKLKNMIVESAQKAAISKKSQWQGDVGTKISIQVTLERSIGYETQWGYNYIHLFKDADDNIYKWSTGSSLADKVVGGILTGTIKAHDEYDGIKQTAVTRCKIS